MRNRSHRFWLCIAAAVAVSVIAVPAASAGVNKYDTKVTITHESRAFGPCHPGVPAGRCVLWHGDVQSEVRKCMEGRRVVLFRQLPGADRKLGTDRSHFVRRYDSFDWYLDAPSASNRAQGDVYAKVTRKVGDGFVCLGDRTFYGT